MIGGADREANHYNDVHVFDTESSSWSNVTAVKYLPIHIIKLSLGFQISPQGMFEARSGHSATAIGHHIYIFGGINVKEGKIFDSLHVLDTGT